MILIIFFPLTCLLLPLQQSVLGGLRQRARFSVWRAVLVWSGSPSVAFCSEALKEGVLIGVDELRWWHVEFFFVISVSIITIFLTLFDSNSYCPLSQLSKEGGVGGKWVIDCCCGRRGNEGASLTRIIKVSGEWMFIIFLVTLLNFILNSPRLSLLNKKHLQQSPFAIRQTR